jgi:hypothetical protein
VLHGLSIAKVATLLDIGIDDRIELLRLDVVFCDGTEVAPDIQPLPQVHIDCQTRSRGAE